MISSLRRVRELVETLERKEKEHQEEHRLREWVLVDWPLFLWCKDGKRAKRRRGSMRERGMGWSACLSQEMQTKWSFASWIASSSDAGWWH